MSDHELPKGWRWARLDEISRVVGGSTPQSGEPRFWNGSVRWITPTDLGRLDGAFIYDSDRKITQEGYTSCGTEMVPVGSVVLSSRAPIGHLGIAAVPLCTNQGCKTFVPNSRVESNFLYWALRRAVPELQALGSGATFAEVSKGALEAFCIPLPPLDEQRRIAARLTQQLAAVEAARVAVAAQRAAADNLSGSLMRNAFPTPGAQLPKEWRWVPLGDVLTRRNEMVHPYDNPTGHGVFVGLEHIESHTGRRVGELQLDLASLTGRKPRFCRGDIVYGYLRPYLNKVWIADFDGFSSVDQYAFTVHAARADTAYVAAYMRSPTYLALAPIDQSPGQLPRIRSEEVAETPIPLPSLAAQREIASRFAAQSSASAVCREQIASQLSTIDTLPAALLRAAFSGKL